MEQLPNYITEGNQSTFVMEWNQLKGIVHDSLFNGGSPLIRKNRTGLERCTSGVSSWNGYSNSDLKSWVTKGFRTDNLGIEIMPPVREKRRYRYAEDAEEMHIDRVLSGEDNYSGEWTKRKIIPGVSIIAEIDFASSVSASIVNKYNVFLCQCIQSLESSGVDCEITVRHSATGLLPGISGLGNTVVRLKRQNEATDFGAFSAMISPAAFRTFMFAAMYAHAEKRGELASGGLGYGRNRVNPNHKWDVTMDDKTGQIIFDCPRSPSDFPKSDMLAKFRQVLGLVE